MTRIVFQSDVPPNALASLLEGYLAGLSEVCHTLFGAKGEAVMYEAVGDAFKRYLKEKNRIEFLRPDPWERYCEIIEFFTARGFYSRVELDAVGGGRYWMLESGQYAGNIWEEQGSWERGTPPCPLWAVIVCSLSEIGYRVVLDEVAFRGDVNGYESTFHFEKIQPGSERILGRARREIQESIFATSMLNLVADNTTDAIFLKNLEGRYLFANNAVCGIANRPIGEILGNDDSRLFPPESAARIREYDREVVRSGEVVTREETVTSGGVTRTYLSTKGVFRDREGNPGGLFGISRDITDRKRAEEELRAREERLRVILGTAMDGFWVLDIEGRLREVNETFCRMSGYGREELLSMSVFDLEASETRGETIEHLQRVFDRGEDRFESRHRRKDGSTYDIEISVKSHPVDGGRLVAFLRDITDRKRSEERLRRALQQLNAHIDNSPLAVAEIDSGLRVTRWSKGAERIFGWSPEEIMGQNVFEIRMVHEEDEERVQQESADLLSGEKRRSLTVGRNYRKDGSVVHCEWYNSGIYDDSGNLVSILSLGLDVTERRRSEEERERLQSQLLQAMKMEALGRLAGGIAHDFNNLLTVITGYCELLQGKIGPESSLHREVGEIRRAGERAALFTQQLLAFSRKQIIEPKVVRLDRLVADLHSMLARLIGEDISIRVTAGKDLGSVKIDPVQFQQVLMNLSVNARDAMPEGGELEIETSNVDLDEVYCAAHPYVVPGRYVMLSVTDTGRGMSEEVKSHIFEPFFTTKGQGRGTGLGLATTYGVVKQSGGSIEVFSGVGAGTTIRIYLPRVEGIAAEPEKELPRKGLPGGAETVLLVEDEDSVRSLCARMLADLGYRVMEARNGPEAIALARGHGGRIDLLLTDVVMPEMNGNEMAMQLVLLHPEVKVLFTSGYTEGTIAHRGVLDEGVSFLGKPYSQEGLASKVREVLDSE